MLGTLRLERICIAFLLVASSALAIATYGASPVRAAPSAVDEVFVQLADELGEPRHYCVDIPGYPFPDDISTYREAQWALEAHTCKTGVPNQDLAKLDQLISLEAGKIRFTRLDVCLEVSTFTDDTGVTVREDAPMIVNPCRNIPAQQIVLADDGRVHPVIDQTKCLTVATRALEAGDRAPGQPWYRRPMTFSTCEDSASDRQVWAAVMPPPQNAEPAGPAEPRDPPGVLQQLWSIVDVPNDGVGEPVEDETFIQTSNQDLATMDQMISRSALEDGQVRFARLNVCLQIAVLTDDAGTMSVWEDAPRWSTLALTHQPSR